MAVCSVISMIKTPAKCNQSADQYYGRNHNRAVKWFTCTLRKKLTLCLRLNHPKIFRTRNLYCGTLLSKLSRKPMSAPCTKRTCCVGNLRSAFGVRTDLASGKRCSGRTKKFQIDFRLYRKPPLKLRLQSPSFIGHLFSVST